MALTRDGMESNRRHGELTNGHSQLMDFVGMQNVRCRLSEYVLQERLLRENPQSLVLNK